jgi:hypothetical protein
MYINDMKRERWIPFLLDNGVRNPTIPELPPRV